MKTKNNEIREGDCIKSLVSTLASVCKREKFGVGSFTHKMGKIYKNNIFEFFFPTGIRLPRDLLSPILFVAGRRRSAFRGSHSCSYSETASYIISLLSLMQSAVGAVSCCMYK